VSCPRPPPPRLLPSFPTRRSSDLETAHYINHRLARASVGAPMEFDRAVTNRIHARSGGVPRLINVIADATLVFGYGEERSLIDRSEEHTSELQSRFDLVCRLLLEK